LFEPPLDLARDGKGGVQHRNAGSCDLPDDREEEGVVSAAQDQGVCPFFDQGGDVPGDESIRLGRVDVAPLHQFDEARAGLHDDLRVLAVVAGEPGKPLAGKGPARGQDADDPRAVKGPPRA